MISLQYFLPQRLSSWCIRKLTRIKTPWFKNAFIKAFTTFYPINWAESLYKTPADFEHFNAFFTRQLEANARPIHQEAIIVAPADGKIAAYGTLSDTQFINAKGHDFKLESLIAEPTLAQQFCNGTYTTIYLSPRDYHRVHMPIAGTLTKMIHIPGKLYSVSLKTAQQIPTLFAENERVVCVFDTEIGQVILILVGAINVSSIETVWAGAITPPYGTTLQYHNYNATLALEKGVEMGRFNMGSTAIILTQTNEYSFDDALSEMAPIKMGAPLLKKLQ